ncbi:YcdB/YcdC domain-containing protein, partial [Bacillus paralicheniformis]|uniref:YcdB/YcdC domain-containing protein n=1 Tax=Bacillus paralicheniformis TaxID=1648923 RepID=UPI0035D64718
HDLSRDLLVDNKVIAISKDAALKKATDYLKEWAPSYLHEYSLPIEDAVFYQYSKEYYFTFPRIMNGIAVVGDGLYVGIGSDGSLRSLSVYKQKIDSWPSINKVISVDKAKEAYS